MSVEPFNMRQWAENHDKQDDARFASIFRILGVAGVALLSVTGWSLVAQYDGMKKQVETAQVQLLAIQQVRTEIQQVSKTVEQR